MIVNLHEKGWEVIYHRAHAMLPADERALEIASGPDGNSYDVVERSDGNVTVKPWPFQEEKFTVNVEACYLEQLKFDSNDELAQALQTAPIKTLEWTFVYDTPTSRREAP